MRFNGIFFSEAVFQTYIEVSEAEVVRSKVPWGFQVKDVTGKWDPKSWLKNDTHAAEGLATTDSGSTVQTSTPDPQPITSSEAEIRTQCGNYLNLLSFRFYVKSILQLPEVQKLLFLQI